MRARPTSNSFFLSRRSLCSQNLTRRNMNTVVCSATSTSSLLFSSSSSFSLFKTTKTLLQQQQQRYYEDEDGGNNWSGAQDDDFAEPLDNGFADFNNNNNNNANSGYSANKKLNNNNNMTSEDGYDESGEILPPSASGRSSSSASRSKQNGQSHQQKLQQPPQHRDPRRNIEEDDDSPEALNLVSSLGADLVRNAQKDLTKENISSSSSSLPPPPPPLPAQSNFTPASTTTLFSSSASTPEKTSSSFEQQEDARKNQPTSSLQKTQISSLERQLGETLKKHLQSVTPGPSNDQLEALLAECKDGRQLNQILDELILPHPMMHDMLNGHGFRVFIFTKVAVAGLRLSQAAPWLRLMRFVRTRGFKLTRTYVTYCLDALRKETSVRFNKEGRNPHIAIDVLSNLRYLLLMAAEDGVYCDWVLMTKTLFVVTAVVAVFDRQNLYRSNWPVSGEVPRREGIVSEWVICHDRPLDYDKVNQLADRIVDGLIVDARERFRSRPPFSFVQRLADYYFATDNLEKMICVLEEALEMNVAIGESSTAKLMQLACAFNHPKVPELFFKFRVQLPQCMLAAPDFSRLLFWYARSGGGRKCPACGEPFNHRNVSLETWSQHTTHAQKKCHLLAQARTQKGEFENNSAERVPQCADWSREARALLELSQSRAIAWTSIEWRGFILCHIFAKKEVALEALQLLQDNLARRAWDDFLAQHVIRLLRYHAPRRILPTIRQWQDTLGLHISPLVVQEAAVGVMSISKHEMMNDPSEGNALAERVEGLKYLTQIARAAEIYTMTYTERTLLSSLDVHAENGDTNDAEELAVRDFCSIAPRALREDDRKDSCSDIRPATNKKSSVFVDAERFFPAMNGGGSGTNAFDF